MINISSDSWATCLPNLPPKTLTVHEAEQTHWTLDAWRPLKNAQFRSSSRKASRLGGITAGIHGVFRGLQFESDAEIERKGAFCKDLI